MREMIAEIRKFSALKRERAESLAETLKERLVT
jgi:hypothetical protein